MIALAKEQEIMVETPNTNPAPPNAECEVCPFCELQSKNRKELKKHIQNIHMTRNVRTDQDAIFSEDSETCSRCTECPYIGSENELVLHSKANHAESFMAVKHKEPEHITTKTVPPIEPFPCQNCALVFINFKSWRRCHA